MNADKPTPPAMAINKFLEFSCPKMARKTLMKLYFNADRAIVNEQDRQEVFFLYSLLENCEQKSPD
jgi:hypothetical protein